MSIKNNNSSIYLHFRSADTNNNPKCNTEDEIVDLLEKGRILFHGCSFRCNDNIDFISEVKLTLMIEKLIMSDDEYKNKISKSNIKQLPEISKVNYSSRGR